jgi:regulator of cell morphogenesis and NO signaling
MPWSDATLDALIRHIVRTHHAFLREELPVIDCLIAKWSTAGEERSSAPQSIRRLFRQFRRELDGHLKKEEDVLFPMIANIESAVTRGARAPRQTFGSIAHPIAIMEAEHEFARQCLEALRDLMRECTISTEIRARMTAVERDLDIHSGLEDRILFPRAIKMESAAR